MQEFVSSKDYFGKFLGEATQEHLTNSKIFLERLNRFLTVAVENGVELVKNPKTGTFVSGEQYGGFRPAGCTVGAPNSSHKKARGGDVYDPSRKIAKFAFDNQHILVECELYLESPTTTNGWCHLSDLPPKSGNRVFLP